MPVKPDSAKSICVGESLALHSSHQPATGGVTGQAVRWKIISHPSGVGQSGEQHFGIDEPDIPSEPETPWHGLGSVGSANDGYNVSDGGQLPQVAQPGPEELLTK